MRYIHSVAIFISTLAASAADNPRGFFRKVRIRLRDQLVARTLMGRFVGNREVVLHDDSTTDDLKDPILPSQSSALPRPGRNGVLYLVNSCLPHTMSGYTVRTQHLAKAFTSKDFRLIPTTRVGYPATVGKLPRAFVTHFDGVEYQHLLTFVQPLRHRGRRDHVIQLITDHARLQGCAMVHTTSDFRNAVVASAAAANLGVPWIYEVRGERDRTLAANGFASTSFGRDFIARFRHQETQAMRAASAVIVLSDVSKRDVIARGVAPENVHVLPNGIDQSVLERHWDRDEARRKLGLSTDVHFVGTVTSIVDYEGLDFLISSLVHLDDDVHALIVGDGQARPSLERLARELRLAHRVHFVGRQPQDSIEDWYAALDVFAVPRKDVEVCRRVTPLKPLMALGVGVPVVASDLPALREVTGGYAEFVPPDDPVALAAAVERVLLRDGKQSDSAHEGVAKFLRDRTWQSNAQRLASIYRSVTDKANRRE